MRKLLPWSNGSVQYSKVGTVGPGRFFKNHDQLGFLLKASPILNV